MRARIAKGALISALGLTLFACPAAAQTDPLFVFAAPISVPPGSGFEDPCGVGVDSKGSFYVSDYHHDAVDVFTGSRGYLTQLVGVDADDGPCALAIDPEGRLYVNDYHRAVARYVPSAYPIVALGSYGPPTAIPTTEPTGISVDPLGGDLYVNERTQISRFDSSGSLLAQIGQGSIEDGYGVAVSRYPVTAGYLYVPDAQDDVVEIYDPATSTEEPIDTLEGPNGGFSSLRDAAIAVDRQSGEIYVADRSGPQEMEHPEARVEVFAATGEYEGHLKYDVIDSHPVGLAVDNSPTATQGRVYVTSGNSEGASVYAYGPGSATTQPPLCAPGGFCGGTGGVPGATFGRSTIAPAQGAPKGPSSPGPASASELTQKGQLRLAVAGRIAPKRLPRRGEAPIAVSLGGRVSTTDGSRPPQLKTLAVEINRHGRLDYAGLPTCPYGEIQPASSQRALAACRSSLVGQGSFEGEIILAGQEPYPTKGKLLLFNGKSKGKSVLFGQIYSPHPFATSFVIVFAIKKLPHGTYGTELSASLPKAMGTWGNLTGLQMTLSRSFSYRGKRHSYVSAGCPAPKGFPGAVFPLARASFGFAGGRGLASVLSTECRVR